MRKTTFITLVVIVLTFSISAYAQKPVILPDLHSKRLLNDLQTTVAAAPYLGENMTIGLVVRYGATYDPKEKGGLANLTSKMFMMATTDRTLKEIQDELDDLGATIEVKCDWDGIRFLLKAKNTNYEKALLLLYQVVVEAKFEESDFIQVKNRILGSVQKISDPRKRINAQFENVLFAGTSYGHLLEGTRVTLAPITIGDVRHFYNKYFSPSQASLLVVGNVPADQVLQKASRIWGAWVKVEDIPFTFAAPRNPAGRQMYVEDDPNSPAAQFVIGNLFPRRDDPAYISALLASHILQERLTKMFPTSLLTVKYEGRRMQGPFYIQGQAAADQAFDLIKKIEDAAAALDEKPVTDEELKAAQAALIDNFNGQLNTAEGLCDILLDSELYLLGSNFASVFPDQVKRCDAQDIKQASNNYIFPGGETLLLRGSVSALKPSLDIMGSFKPLFTTEF